LTLCFASKGLCGILGPGLWYALLPGIGIGRTYYLWILWAFQVRTASSFLHLWACCDGERPCLVWQVTVITAVIHLLVCSAAVVWVYKIHEAEHHFEKLPSVDDWGGESPWESSEVAPEPDTAEEMEMDTVDVDVEGALGIDEGGGYCCDEGGAGPGGAQL